MMENSRTTDNHNENERVRTSGVMTKKMFHWRDSLFHAFLPENGEFESMLFYFHPTYKPSNTIVNSIVRKGGCIVDDPSQDLYTVILVSTKSDNYKPDTQFKERYDLFDSAFVERCVEKKQLVDLNLYRIGESTFEDYDANKVLHRTLKWSDINKKQQSPAVRIAPSNSNKNLASCSKDPTTIKSTNQSKASKNIRNEKEETSQISIAPPTSESSIIVNDTDNDHLEISNRKRIHRSSSQPQRSGTKITKINRTPLKSSTPLGSVEKRKAKVLVYTSDSASSSSDVDETKSSPSKARNANPSAKVIQPSSETAKDKSLSRKGTVRNTVMNTSNEPAALESQTDSHPSNDEITSEYVTRSKSKNSPQKSSESSVEKNLSPAKNTRSRAVASTSTTEKAKIPACSKNTVDVSKPSTSASAVASTKPGVGDTSKYFKLPLKPYSRVVPPKIPRQNVSNVRAAPSVVSNWLSAIRDSEGSTPSPKKAVNDQTKRRYLDVDDARSTRSISPIESLNGDDFDNRSVISSASTATRRQPYTPRERQAMLQFVCTNDYHNWTRGNKIWEQCEYDKIVPGRTWQSLREHFTKRIMPNIMKNPSVTALDKQKFARAIKLVKMGRREEAPIQVTRPKTS